MPNHAQRFCYKNFIFLECLDTLSKTEDTFSLMNLTTRLTFDVVGKLVMETDLDAQHFDPDKKGELVDLFETLLGAYNGDHLNLPRWFNFRKVRRQATLSNRISTLLETIVRRKHAKLHEKREDVTNTRSVLSLSLKDIPTLTPSIVDETCDQLHTFLRGAGFAARKQERCLDGLLVYNCQSIIHRDPRAFGDTADDFVPERWPTAAAATTAPPPPPRSRPARGTRLSGPRNCIGQEPANVEARVVIALAVRQYGFVKVGLGEVALDENGRPSLDNEKGQYKVVEELYPVSSSTTCGCRRVLD